MTNMPHRNTLENILIVTLLTFAPLALGSVHTWAYCTLAFLALTLFNIHFLSNTSYVELGIKDKGEGIKIEDPCEKRASFKKVLSPFSFLLSPSSSCSTVRIPEVVGALVFLAVALFYIVPLPAEVVKYLSPKTWALWQDYTLEAPSFVTLSPCIHATMLYIVKFVTYLMVFLVIVSKCQSVKVSKYGEAKDEGRRRKEKALERIPPFSFTLPPSSLDTRYPVLNSYVLLGALCAVLSILIHSLSDFNLQIPANALYFTVMLALVTGLSTSVSKCQSVKVSKCGEAKDEGRRRKEEYAECSGTFSPSNFLLAPFSLIIRGLWSAKRPNVILSEAKDLDSSSPRSIGAPQNDSEDAERRTQNAERHGEQSPVPDTQYPILNTKFVTLLTHALILIGFTVALFGILQKLSYNGKIYWLIEKAGGHFGPYVNYDHYAGFMEMCAIFTIAVFIGNVASSSFAYTRRFIDKVLWFSTKEANKCLMYLFLAVVMATALFMTTSRGGIMSFIAACAVLYFACLISAESRKRKRMLLATLLVIVLIVVMFSWVGPEETIGRFKGLQEMIKTFIKENAILSEIRPLMWHDTINMIKDFPITGTGLGTYSYIFSKYRTFEVSYGFLRFAHNDYLNFLAEMGAVGGAFLAGFFVWYVRKFRNCVARLRKSGD